MHKWWWHLLENLICAEQWVQMNGGRHKQEQYSGPGAVLKGNPLCSCSIISSTEQVTEWEDNDCRRKTTLLAGKWWVHENILWSVSLFIMTTWPRRSSPLAFHVRTKEATIGQMNYDCDKILWVKWRDLWAQHIIKSRKGLSIIEWSREGLSEVILPLWGQGDWLHWASHYLANLP